MPKTVVLDPRGTQSSHVHRMARRPRTLEGIRLVLFDNRKPNGDLLLEQVANRLVQRHELKSVTTIAKHSPTAGAEPEIYDRLAQADLVLVALADCGGCTAWCAYDAIELERRGVPTLTFVSEAFVAMANAQARSRGLPGLPMVRIPHPFGQLPREEVLRAADAAIRDIERLALVPAAKAATATEAAK